MEAHLLPQHEVEALVDLVLLVEAEIMGEALERVERVQ
jgi:hypothetical protein